MDHEHPGPGLGIVLNPPQSSSLELSETPRSSDTIDINSCVSNCGTSTKSLPPTPAQDESLELANAGAHPNSSTGRDDYRKHREETNLDEWSVWTALNTATILGDTTSRLKAGVKFFPNSREEGRLISLERAKRKPRVDVDIYLKSNVGVEGGFFEGCIRIKVKKCPKNSQPVWISGGKVRVIGLETSLKDGKRFVFYQSSSELADVTDCALEPLYCSEPDNEGYAQAKEGLYSLPFTLHLSSLTERGSPKACVDLPGVISVGYIIMVSLRIKKPTSETKSIAHFYRDCTVWPRLNPSAVLAPAPRPLQVTVSEDSFASNGKVYLTISMHRLYWIAGQLCHVKIRVANGSKKRLKSLSLEVIQKTTTFKDKINCQGNQEDGLPPAKFEAQESSSTYKEIAQSTLIAGERGTRGHASANGWWMGVGAGEMQTFLHSILIPDNAISIAKGKLVEVSYILKASIRTGTLLFTDLHASLPIEIINMMSVDPPPGCIQSILMYADQPLEVIDRDRSEPDIHAHSLEESFRCQSPYSSESGDGEDDYDSEDNGRIQPEKYLSAPRNGDEENHAQNHVLSKQNHPQTGLSLRFSDLYLSSFKPNDIDRQGQKVSGFSMRVEQKTAKLKSVSDSKDNDPDHKQEPTYLKNETQLESTPEDLSGDSSVLSAPEEGKQAIISRSMAIQDPYISTTESLYSAPRPKSVKEKIRELEVLAARV